MAKNLPRKSDDEPEKERVSNENQKTFYCDPVLWEKAQIFIKAAQIAAKGKPGPRPPKSTSKLIVDLLTKHIGKNGPKLGVRLPERLTQKPE